MEQISSFMTHEPPLASPTSKVTLLTIFNVVSNQRISHDNYFEVNFFVGHKNRSKSIFLMSLYSYLLANFSFYWSCYGVRMPVVCHAIAISFWSCSLQHLCRGWGVVRRERLSRQVVIVSSGLWCFYSRVQIELDLYCENKYIKTFRHTYLHIFIKF